MKGAKNFQGSKYLRTSFEVLVAMRNGKRYSRVKVINRLMRSVTTKISLLLQNRQNNVILRFLPCVNDVETEWGEIWVHYLKDYFL